MKNAILPSISSQQYGFGNVNEAITEVPAQIDCSLSNLYENSISPKPESYDDYSYWLLHDQCDIAPPPPPRCPIDYQPVPSSLVTSQRFDHHSRREDSPKQPFLPLSRNKLSTDPRQGHELEAIKPPRKRSNEVLPGKGSQCCVENQWRAKKKTTSMAHRHMQLHDDLLHEVVPQRRSQKLSDKVTALQKLVSPYGKTDTASVLQEAAISIKLLLHQIRNLLEKLNTPTPITTEGPLRFQASKALHGNMTMREVKQDLSSRGICLVPISYVQSMTKQQLTGTPPHTKSIKL